jgi:nucleotide-binding universal stress UspA family protein
VKHHTLREATVFKHILVAIDGSTYAESAHDFAMGLAKRLGAVLHGVHVIDVTFIEGAFVTDVSGALGFEPFLNMQAQMRTALEDLATNLKTRFERRCAEAGVAHEFHTERASVVHGLLDAARLADVLVIGQRGVNARFHPDLLGNVSAVMLRRSPIPVFVVPLDVPSPRTIMVGYDGSSKAVAALRCGAGLAKSLSIPLKVVNVGDQVERASACLDEAATYLAPFDLDLELQPIQGEATEEVLLHLLTDGRADLLALGSHGRSRIVELVLGSTSEYLARRAPVSILCVTRA